MCLGGVRAHSRSRRARAPPGGPLLGPPNFSRPTFYITYLGRRRRRRWGRWGRQGRRGRRGRVRGHQGRWGPGLWGGQWGRRPAAHRPSTGWMEQGLRFLCRVACRPAGEPGMGWCGRAWDEMVVSVLLLAEGDSSMLRGTVCVLQVGLSLLCVALCVSAQAGCPPKTLPKSWCGLSPLPRLLCVYTKAPTPVPPRQRARGHRLGMLPLTTVLAAATPAGQRRPWGAPAAPQSALTTSNLGTASSSGVDPRHGACDGGMAAEDATPRDPQAREHARRPQGARRAGGRVGGWVGAWAGLG